MQKCQLNANLKTNLLLSANKNKCCVLHINSELAGDNLHIRPTSARERRTVMKWAGAGEGRGKDRAGKVQSLLRKTKLAKESSQSNFFLLVYDNLQ